MIGVGIITHGPEPRSTPAYGAIVRLADGLGEFRPSVEFDVEIVFELAGSMGRADHEGVKVGRYSERDHRIQVFVAIPDDVSASPSPDLAIIDLAERAVVAAGEIAAKRGADVDVSGLRHQLAEARDIVGRLGPAGPRPLSAAEIEQDRIEADVLAEYGIDTQPAAATSPSVQPPGALSRFQIELTLPIPDLASQEAAFVFEGELATRLEEAAVGYLEGNEIGGGIFEIVACGPKFGPMHGVVASAVDEMWRGGRVELRFFDGDEEVEPLAT